MGDVMDVMGDRLTEKLEAAQQGDSGSPSDYEESFQSESSDEEALSTEGGDEDDASDASSVVEEEQCPSLESASCASEDCRNLSRSSSLVFFFLLASRHQREFVEVRRPVDQCGRMHFLLSAVKASFLRSFAVTSFSVRCWYFCWYLERLVSLTD